MIWQGRYLTQLGSTYQIPKLDKILIQLRNTKIRQVFKQGASVQNLVRRYKLTRQMINLIVTSEADGVEVIGFDQPSLLGVGAGFNDSYLSQKRSFLTPALEADNGLLKCEAKRNRVNG
ncbi:Mor transcription activator family protein [Pseudoalteromonas luteoviolacea]|uniref:Mor transcription activator family protein n=1 Tax=Pseudoalteromonas luteoviolacea TaxID=43657 RepID=UPI00114E5E27|nr:Mor transcription activator family protein [Pseudoalteromonas luteoviolacea]TQF70724.1 hypothetical protein FLM44_06445 [Pseudoalteromonas luteoviolacea]